VSDPATVDQLQSGDHACITFSDEEERLDIVAAFVSDGLRCGQRVLCLTQALTPDAMTTAMLGRGLPVDAAARSGQLTVASSSEMFLADGRFAPDRTLEVLSGQIDQAERQGYDGLRVASDMGWALGPVSGVEQLVDFEGTVGRLLADRRATAVCQYDRHGFDPVSLASVTAAHPRTVAAVVYHEDPVLRICRQHVPPGVRLAGELDGSRIEPLRLALTEAMRLDGDIHVNAGQLRFIDAASAGVLVQVALALPAGRRMAVVCRPLTCKVLVALRADEIPHLRLVVINVD
jgi:anti-anti-sigma regulatory factor